MPATTDRLALPYPQGGDPDDPPADLQALAEKLDTGVGWFGSGTLANRPASSAGAPGIVDRYYYATDVELLYRDTGTGWTTIGAAVGQDADIATLAFGDAADAGASGKVADAGHVHGMPANPLTAHLDAEDPHPQYALASEGPAADRPAAGRAGARYYATDTGAEYLDDGAAWQTVADPDLPKKWALIL